MRRRVTVEEWRSDVLGTLARSESGPIDIVREDGSVAMTVSGAASLDASETEYERGRRDERERILGMARRHNYGPTLRTFCKWIARGYEKGGE